MPTDLRALFNRSTDGLAICRKQRIIEANPALAALLGYPSVQALVGESAVRLVPPSHRAALEQRLTRLEAGGIDAASEATFTTSDGREIAVEASGASIPADDGGHLAVLVVRDARARREREGSLAQADRLKSMGTLAAGTAHEVNGPLGFTLANVGFSLDELRGLDEDLAARPGDVEADLAARIEVARVRLRGVADALQEARRGAERIRGLARDLKTFAGVDDESRDPLDLRRVIESSINLAYAEVRGRARLVKDYAESPLVDGNAARLGQVFLNLLVNAAEALPEGDDPDRHEIRITTRTNEHGQCVVEVSDTGCGITPEEGRRVFEPFATSKPGPRAGLGLSICQSAVVAHGGHIAFESTPGRGTRFRVTLPASTGQPRRPTPPPRVSSIAPTRRGRLLVIDDEPMMARAVERLFNAEHDVTTSTDPRAAVDLVRSGQRFDVILCDLMMPRMSGMDVYEAVVSFDPELGRRFVFMTGGAFTPRVLTFLDSIDNPRVDKPIDRTALHAIIRAQLVETEPSLPGRR